MSKKRRLREEIRQELQALSPASKRKQSQIICSLIQENALWQQSSAILGFYPFRNEVDLVPLYIAALHEEKKLYLPRMNERNIKFRQVEDMDLLEVNSLGIKEPPERAELWQGGSASFMLLPGLLFTRNGERLGWGGGYYDRWLQSHKDKPKNPEILAGVAYREQLRDKLPVDSWDIPISHIVSPDGFIPCSL